MRNTAMIVIKSSIVGAAVAAALAFGTVVPADAQERANADIELYVQASENLLVGIEELSERQRNSIGALLAIDRVLTRYDILGARTEEGMFERYRGQLVAFSPGLAEFRPPLVPLDACMDSHVAYAMAVQSCENEDPPRGEDECFESWGPSSDVTQCMLRELKDVEERLLGFGDRFMEPLPFGR